MRIVALILIALMLAPVAQAKPNKQNPSNGHCPPGLAKKTPACIPPGLAAKGYVPGDILPEDEDHDWVLEPLEFNLPEIGEGEAYVQIGDFFVKVNRETAEIINLFNALGQVLN